MNLIYATDAASSEQNTRDLGQWIADYLQDQGYHPDVQHHVIKLMIMSAFPTISKGGTISPDNVEQVLTNTKAVDNTYLQVFSLPGNIRLAYWYNR